MPMNESQRKANRKWDNAHYTQLPCKIRRDKADAFRAACKAAGTTPNFVLNSAADAFMQERGGWDAWTASADAEAAAGEATDPHQTAGAAGGAGTHHLFLPE